jgi:hypothetical protein
VAVAILPWRNSQYRRDNFWSEQIARFSSSKSALTNSTALLWIS